MAIRLASSDVLGLTWREAEEMLNTYIRFLSKCQACEGTGRLSDNSICPNCDESGYDDSYVLWRCWAGHNRYACLKACGQDNTECGPTLKVSDELIPKISPASADAS